MNKGETMHLRNALYAYFTCHVMLVKTLSLFCIFAVEHSLQMIMYVFVCVQHVTQMLIMWAFVYIAQMLVYVGKQQYQYVTHWSWCVYMDAEIHVSHSVSYVLYHDLPLYFHMSLLTPT